MMAVQNPTTAYFSFQHPSHSHSHTHTHGHSHGQPISSPPAFYSQPSTPSSLPHQHSSTPIASSSSSSQQKPNGTLHHSSSLKCRPRPKLPKKPSCSTRDKRTDVQQNLEMKVEKAKGFHAFFVPLGKGVPAAPPSSPVLGARNPTSGLADGQGNGLGKDYFEDWVEDIGRKVGGGGVGGGAQGNAMDLD